MSKPTDVWMPTFIGDFLKETMHFNAGEYRAYHLLLMHCWLHDGAVSNDPKILKNVARLSKNKLSKVLALFTEKDGYLYHEKMTQELIKARNNKEKKAHQTEAARLAKLAKLEKTSSITESVTENVTNAPSPSSLPLHSSFSLPAQEQEPPGFAEFWTAYPATATTPKEAYVAYWRALAIGATPEILLKAAEEYHRQLKAGKLRSIYNPATWLDSEQWNYNKPARYENLAVESS